jgi:hypothetical protein
VGKKRLAESAIFRVTGLPNVLPHEINPTRPGRLGSLAMKLSQLRYLARGHSQSYDWHSYVEFPHTVKCGSTPQLLHPLRNHYMCQHAGTSTSTHHIVECISIRELSYSHLHGPMDIKHVGVGHGEEGSFSASARFCYPPGFICGEQPSFLSRIHRTIAQGLGKWGPFSKTKQKKSLQECL